MSGKQLAVDRSVILDLNRHLRYAAPHKQLEDLSERDKPGRPDALALIEAISNAAAAISSQDDRIRQLEHQNQDADDLIERMKSKLGELLRLQQTTDAFAKAEGERAARAEAVAAELRSRVEAVEADLEGALGDLNRIADVITGSLLPPPRR